LSAKEKKEKRRLRKEKPNSASPPPVYNKEADDILPLSNFASKILSLYPDLEHFFPLPLNWDSDSQNVLFQFCLQFHPKISSLSSNLLAQEYDKQRKERTQTILPSQKNALKLVKSFETSWPQLCARLQLLSKWILAPADDHDDDRLGMREGEFLRTVAADFGSRLTGFCVFGKDDVESFSFGDGSPTFEEDVGMSQRSFPTVFLTSSKTKEGDKDALQVLREDLGSAGVLLARMWILIGGDSYHGGKRTQENGDVVVRKGDFTGFLRHLEENCLSMCGLPFKILDKKTEKQAMFTRRQDLQNQLTEASNPKDILDITVLLLFQKTKRFAIVGDLAIATALDIVLKDEKLPTPIVEKLTTFAQLVRDNREAKRELLEFVRKCGLCKDVSKLRLEEDDC